MSTDNNFSSLLKQYFVPEAGFVKDLLDSRCRCGKIMGAGRKECDECEKNISNNMPDIEIFMCYSSCSETEAIEALQVADGDIVTALLGLK